MRRRQVLAALGTTIPFAGCLSKATSGTPRNGTPSPTHESGLAITVPTVSPGDTVPISITARSVLHLRFSDVPESEMTVEYANADFSPPPTAVWQRIPPTWQWTPPTPVTGDIPLRVSVAVDPGDYHFTIAVKRADTEEEVFKSFTVSGGEA